MTGTRTEAPGIPPIEERYDLRHLTTFIPNKKLPVHNWFYFKEGFARDFVTTSLSWMGIESGVVLDPFMGVGTTPLTAREIGMSSIGVDVSPLMVLVSRAKCEDHDIGLLESISSEILSAKFVRPSLSSVPNWIRRYFNKYLLEDIVFFKHLIDEVDVRSAKDFLLVLLMSSAMKASYAYKDGAVLKVVRRSTPPFRKFFKSRVRKAIKDLRRSNLVGPEPTLQVGDARRMDFLEDSSVDCVVTSPPYLNKIEYTRMYSIEYELFLPHVRPASIRSYLGVDSEVEETLFPQLPTVANAYFSDLRRSLSEMHRVLRDGSKAAVLVAGGVFPTGVVDSDIYLSNLAIESGFQVDRIIALNKRVATRDRVIKIGWARESAIIMSK